jgi:hypothetical protein
MPEKFQKNLPNKKNEPIRGPLSSEEVVQPPLRVKNF